MVAAMSNSAAVAASTWVTSFLERLPAPAGELEAVQWRGREALSRQPLPSRRQEDWRFTDLAPLTALAPAPAPSSAQAGWPAPAADVFRLWLDAPGDLLSGQSLPAGLSLLSSDEVQQALGHTLAACNCEQHWPVELNQASATRVLALRVSGAVAPTLELVSQAAEDGVMRPVRVLLLLEEKASLEVLQIQLGSACSLSSLVMEAHLGRESTLRHGLLALGEGQACFLGHLAVEQEPRSQLESVWASHGWALSRFEPRVVQVDGEATTTLKGLQLASGQQLVDTHSRVEFRGPEGQLDQLHKAIADDHGRSVFNGAVKVPRAAQRTNASQLSRNLLLSNQARIDTKPELEIVADDVRCAHGATVSRLQTDELFYLQSRGLSAAVAAGLLKRGFCEEVLRALPAAASAWRPLQRMLGED
jgi:FeS assembly protein SufD